MIVTGDILSSERFGYITGSKMSILFPKRSAEVGQKSYAKQLANEMFFKYYDNSGTWQTEHGQMNEYHAENHFNTYYNGFGFRPEFLADKENWIGGSPDYVSADFGCDWKCPTTLQGWLDYLHNGIDESQFYQCQTYMYLTGKKLWKICAYLTETMRMIDNGLVYPIAEEKRMIIIDVHYLDQFGEMVIERSKPIIQMRDEYLAKLKEHFEP